MDTKNTWLQHILVGLFSIVVALFFRFFLGVRWSSALARVSFVLLFFTMIIGLWMRIRKPRKVSSPWESPWNWRSELGIWFTITALLHVGFVLYGRPNWSILKALGGGVGGTVSPIL